MVHGCQFELFILSNKKIIKIIPDDLGGDGDPRPLLARGDIDRLSFPAGLMEVSG